jgi:hypothetical protein
MLRASWIALLVCAAALPGCYSPTVKVAADEMDESDRATYLILSDQLQRVRNVMKGPAKVCIGTLPNGHSGGLAPVPPDVVARLQGEQASLEPRLYIIANVECLAHYVQHNAYYEAEDSDVLAYAGMLGYDDNCGPWMGGLYSPGDLSRIAMYDVKVTGGIAELTGGEDCRGIRWIRS